MIKKFFAVLFLLLLAVAAYFFAGLPSRQRIRALAKGNPARTSVMAQRQREAEAAPRKLRHLQKWVGLKAISRHLIHGVVAAEDPNFFGHEGVDWEAVREALDSNIKKRGFVRGGSTITQQLAKNLFFTTYKNPVRKLRE